MSDWKSRARPVSSDWKSRARQQAPTETLQEMPEWLSAGDRFVAKNFAQSPEKQVEFLKKQYPDAEIMLDADKNVVMRRAGESAYRVLDPSFEPFDNPIGTLKDLGSDLGDIVYDTGSGLVQAPATAAGAIGGALTPIPGGAIMGGMAASGASSAALEALRQKIGQYLGIPQEVDGTDVAIAGGMGLGSTALFGAGKATPGLAQYGYKKVKDAGRGVTSFLTGINSDLLNNYSARMGIIDDMPGEIPKAKEISQKALGWADKYVDDAGTKLATSMDQQNVPIDVSGAKKAFLDRIKFLEGKIDLTNAEKAEIASLRGSYDKFFGLAQPKAPSEADVLADPSIKTLFGALDNTVGQSTFNSPAQISEQVSGSVLNPVAAKPLPPPTSNWGRRDIMQSTVPDPNANPVGFKVGEFFRETNDEIMGHAGLLKEEQEALAKAYASKNTSAVRIILDQIEQRKAEFTKENMITHIPDELDALRAWDLQKKLKQAAAFETNMTPETLSAKGSARGAYGAINDSFNEGSDGVIGELKTKYKDALDKATTINSKFGGNSPTETDAAQQAYNTIVGLDKAGRKSLRETLSGLKNEGLDLGQDILDLQTRDAMFNPNTNMIRSRPLAHALGALGGWFGYKSGGGMTGGGLGFIAGEALGNKLANPSSVRVGMKGVRAFESGARNIGTWGGKISTDVPFYLAPNVLADQYGTNIWDQMK